MLLLSTDHDAPRVGDVVLLDFKSIPRDEEADTAEETDALEGNDWVLVTSAVNVRDGPSSSFAVLKVQLKGMEAGSKWWIRTQAKRDRSSHDM
jgi:hypothetical protein